MDTVLRLLITLVGVVHLCGSSSGQCMNCEISDLTVSCWKLGLQTVPLCLPQTITYLDIFQNDIPTIGPNSFQMYPNLEDLLLASNQISAIINDTFSDLLNLRTLSLINNLLTEIQSDIFISNTNLQYLSLSGNFFPSINMQLFRPLTNLRNLNLADVRLAEILYESNDAFSSSLQYLNVAANDLQTIDDSLFVTNYNVMVAFTDNKWFCNCDTSILLNLFRGHNITFAEDPECDEPPGLKGTNWSNLNNLCTTHNSSVHH